MTDILELFSGIGVVIDEQINEQAQTPNGIQKIVASLRQKNIPLVMYDALPEDEELQHFHSVSFIILDWNLSGVNPIPNATITDNIEFIKSLQSYCYVPIFIFSDEGVHDITVQLESAELYKLDRPNNIFIKSKTDLVTTDLLFQEIENWLKTTPSAYVLKEWERATRKARTEMIWGLSLAHPAWPNVLKKSIVNDGEDYNSELLRMLQDNLSSRLVTPELDGDILGMEFGDISKDDLRSILENERFMTTLPDHPFAGDVYKEGGNYLINIRPDCDIIREKKDLYLIKGVVVDESRINIKEENAIVFDSGNFVEKINSCYVAFIEGKIIEFKFRNFSIRKWKEIKGNRIGRLLPPYITRIQQKFSYYLQRQGLPALPIEAIKTEKELTQTTEPSHVALGDCL